MVLILDIKEVVYVTVEQLKAQRKTKKSSFNLYAKRRNSIRDIISNIDGKMNDDISDINRQISNCILEFQQGLKGSKRVAQICSDMESAKEKWADSDSKITSCRSNLSSEVSRCQSKINTLDYEIKQLEGQIKAQGGTIYFWE